MKRGAIHLRPKRMENPRLQRLNLTGHKDEAVCRLLAEEYCRRSGHTVVCTGGFHVDAITPEQIRELMEAISELCKKSICKELYNP